MKNLLLLFTTLVALTSAGCATKQYPQMPPVSEAEAAAFGCDDLRLEVIRAESAQQEIENTGKFDGRTILGVLGDFGVGNGMAKSDARAKAQARLNQLKGLQKAKGCDSQVK